jgi:hypothetical protein
MEIFLRREQQNTELPPYGRYATGIVYLDRTHHREKEAAFAQLAEECELQASVHRVYAQNRLFSMNFISRHMRICTNGSGGYLLLPAQE